MVATPRRPGALGWVVHEAREVKEAAGEIVTFVRTHKWKATAKTVFRRKYWGWWLTLIVSIVLSTLLSQYHNEIIVAIKPYKAAIRKAPAVWLIPIIVLIIVSFPPLFGHEIIILALGVIYSLQVAFLIAIAGTFLGELACFYAAKHFLTNRAKSVENKQIAYACLAKLMRDGGLWVSIIVRFSAIPGHLVTAIQSTIGISVWVYAIAATVSLPKQFALVYLGNVFGQTSMPLEQWRHDHPTTALSVYYSGAESASRRHNISLIVFAATTLSTVFAAMVIWMRVRKVRPFVLAEMAARKAAEAKAIAAGEEDVGEEGIPLEELCDSCVTIVTRPTYLASPSTTGSRVALLAGGRGRSGSNSGFNSPSLPHLPLYSEASQDYFLSRVVVGDDKSEVASPRRGSF